MDKVRLEVVEISSGQVIHSVMTSNPDRVTAGMLINMDRDKFFVREADDDDDR